MTNGRRSSPVPQLKCVGGTAGCHGFQPKVVQCVNTGFDGYDVQWECKTDMDSAYRFGKIQVSCEGYDYPDDPYVLRGSCGVGEKLFVCICTLYSSITDKSMCFYKLTSTHKLGV